MSSIGWKWAYMCKFYIYYLIKTTDHGYTLTQQSTSQHKAVRGKSHLPDYLW